jgi:hypothetical protein
MRFYKIESVGVREMLDLYKISAQLQEALGEMGQDRETLGHDMEELNSAFSKVITEPGILEEFLRQRWDDKKLLLAKPHGEPLDMVKQVPVRPASVEIVSVDGSQSLSPFWGVDWFLVNLGTVRLRLGDDAAYDIQSQPTLMNVERLGREDVPRPEVEMGRRRAVMEIAELASQAENSRNDCYTVAVADGGLTYWFYMQGMQDPGARRTLDEMVAVLPRFRQKGIAVAGYLSGSANRELVNTLSLSVNSKPPLLSDRHFWMSRLKHGERGPILTSNSDVLGKYAPEDSPVFFPLCVGEEVARVEIPEWCIPQVDTIAAVLLDQAGKGGGYPQILTEAHQAAVVTAREADAFWSYLGGLAEKQGMRLGLRPKDSGKRLAGI